LAIDGAGNIFIADGNNSRARRIDSSTGIITTAAGNGAVGFSGDSGPPTSAALASRFPWPSITQVLSSFLISKTIGFARLMARL